MLKPQELFIGAVIWLKSKNKPYEIDDGYDIYKLDEAGELMDAEPIPLTPEILTDWCGWEKVYESKYRIQLWCEPKSEFKFEFFKETKTIVLTWNGLHTNIKYLHQLQALYQLLTGEVMPINLPKNQ